MEAGLLVRSGNGFIAGGKSAFDQSQGWDAFTDRDKPNNTKIKKSLWNKLHFGPTLFIHRFEISIYGRHNNHSPPSIPGIMSEKFCLKWNDFHTNVTSSFGLLRNEDFLHDVTIVTDDNEQIAAHKLVLSACSEYFKNIFKRNKNPNLLLCIEGVRGWSESFEHMEKSNGTFSCKLCGESAGHRGQMRNHIETHLEGLSFNCQHCGNIFRSRNTLAKHIHYQHKSHQ